MHVTTSQYEISGKNHIFSTKTKPSRAQSTHHRKNSLEKSSILAQGKSCVLRITLTSFLHAKLITFQWIQVTDNDLADRWLAITRQEGRIPVCLSTGSHLFPSLTLRFFHPFPKQRACSQATSMLASQTSPVEVELFFSTQTLSFFCYNKFAWLLATWVHVLYT